MSADFDTVFEEFLIRIALTKSQAQRIDSSLIGLSELFVQAFVGDVDIYTQGSFATNTIVKPLTATQSPNGKAGEYDVDIVLQRTSWSGATNSLLEVRETISTSDRYSSLLQPPRKQSCERVEYAAEESGAGFHVDLVPIKLNTSRYVAIRDKDQWRASDPTIIINWFKGLRNNHPYLAANVLTLKRMRDVAALQSTIPSIILLALAGNLYEDKGSYVDDLLHVLKRTTQELSKDHVDIRIPGVPENLAEKWDSAQLKIVREYFTNAFSDLEAAFSSNDLNTVRQYLSSSFPLEKYLKNLHSLRSQGWKIQLDGSLERPTIKPVPEPKDLNRLTRRLLRFTKKGQPVVFNAEKYRLDTNQIVQWQVLNAVNSDKIRGNFFYAKSSDQNVRGDDFQNHETVSYRGIHWIRYFIVNEQTKTVEVASKKYSVELKQ